MLSSLLCSSICVRRWEYRPIICNTPLICNAMDFFMIEQYSDNIWEIVVSYSYFNHTGVSYPITMATQLSTRSMPILLLSFYLLGATVHNVRGTSSKYVSNNKSSHECPRGKCKGRFSVVHNEINSSCRICTNYVYVYLSIRRYILCLDWGLYW